MVGSAFKRLIRAKSALRREDLPPASLTRLEEVDFLPAGCTRQGDFISGYFDEPGGETTGEPDA